jgi:hypothetical protein
MRNNFGRFPRLTACQVEKHFLLSLCRMTCLKSLRPDEYFAVTHAQSSESIQYSIRTSSCLATVLYSIRNRPFNSSTLQLLQNPTTSEIFQSQVPVPVTGGRRSPPGPSDVRPSRSAYNVPSPRFQHFIRPLPPRRHVCTYPRRHVCTYAVRILSRGSQLRR